MASKKVVAVTLMTGLLVAIATGLAAAKFATPYTGQGHAENDSDEGAHDHDEARPNEASKGSGEHGPSTIRLDESQVELAELETTTVTAKSLQIAIMLTGEVEANWDRMVEVVPPVSGVTQAVMALLGQQVREGDPLSTLDSRELADAKADWIAARERTALAAASYERSERLWKKKIAPEEEYLDARTRLAEARIAKQTAEHKLKALGLSVEELESLAEGRHEPFTRYTVRAPIDGTVVEKNITIGAMVDGSRPIYRIADLSTVWVIASVYEKDFRAIQTGQQATIRTRAYPDRDFKGLVTWVSDVVEESSRTLKVRIEIPNPDRALKPGMFTSASVIVDQPWARAVVPESAVRRADGESIIFIRSDPGKFERREIDIGRQAGSEIEILKGVSPGDTVVTDGSFILKAESQKSGFEAGHGH